MTPAGLIRHGTTSACAENTALECAPARDQQNYLRVRGEYQKVVDREILHIGTTSACAENTQANDCSVSKLRNYLRVRGEYGIRLGKCRGTGELPPRARRILAGPVKDFAGNGTTSACAENTDCDRGWRAV